MKGGRQEVWKWKTEVDILLATLQREISHVGAAAFVRV